MELAISNPVLTYCLANNFQFRSHVYRQAVAWEQANMYARRKQKQILKWLGFPETEIIVKLMKRIDTTEMSVGLLRLLRAALKTENPTVKLLSHYQSITPGMLGLLKTSISPFVTPKIVADVANNERERFFPHTAERLTEIHLMKKACPEQVNVRPYQTVRAVREAHEDIELKLRAQLADLRKKEKKRHLSLPDPPIEGTDTIVPITSKAALKLEGKEMKNCVASYVNKVTRGEMYIYKVLSPERATMSIVRNPDGSWRCNELALKCNKMVCIDTQAEVNTWLRKGQKA